MQHNLYYTLQNKTTAIFSFSIAYVLRIFLVMFSVMQLNFRADAQQDSTSKISQSIAVIQDSVISYSEAEFPGGKSAWTLHIMKNLRLPELFNRSFEGNIVVTFTVTETGKLKNFKASEGPEALQEEAIRVIKTSKKWIPAYRNGKPVQSEHQQTIGFVI